jgi:integrase
MPLTDAACRTAKPTDKPHKITDAAGLYLLVQINGSRLWRMDYTYAGKRRTAALGKYPATSLGEARAERERIKMMLREGKDPGAKAAALQSFDQIARRWFADNQAKWKTSYSARFWSRIEDDILPVLGSRPIDQIEPPEILKLLRAIEDREAIYTAKRICEMVNTIFRYAIAEGLIKFNPAADLKPALKPMPDVKHRAKLAESELPEFFRRLRASGAGRTQLALELVVHTFVRPNEIQFGRWDEIDGDVWTIPGERMKMGKTHMVPLTRQSQDLLRRLRDLSDGSPWILPGFVSNKKPVSNNCLLYFLTDLGYGPHSSGAKTTVHGFRGLASTVLNESGLWQSDWIERQLAHVPLDRVRSAYNAAEWWPQRVALMTWWSNRLDIVAGQKSKTDLTLFLS